MGSKTLFEKKYTIQNNGSKVKLIMPVEYLR
jgi:hypothetical protein